MIRANTDTRRIRQHWPRLLLLLAALHCTLFPALAQDVYNQIDEDGNITQRSENRNFNKHNNDTTNHNKEIPKGIYTWTIDRTFGDVIPTEPDTLPHLFMNTTLNTGMFGEYNTTGSNYTARLSRIFMNRPQFDYYIFSQPYGFVEKRPEEFLFINTLSPYTSILYDNCGDKTDGEDHLDAKFAVNANKQLNFGFDLDYAYARGYYSNQSISHFNATLFSSYLGDKYNMHFFFNTAHQKATENGGITDDNYVTHPESFRDNFQSNEIPTVLSQNWNRNDQQQLFFSHRYSLGFYRKVKMTEEELKARKFAEASKKEKAEREDEEAEDRDPSERRSRKQEEKPSGRPDGARIMGAEPKEQLDSIALAAIAADTTRIAVNGQAAIDSLKRAKEIEDSIEATMKREFVPVTSFIHTLEWQNANRGYQSYQTPTGYYRDRYYDQGVEYGNDSIYDKTRYTHIKNTFALALLEGFNKYMKAGLKAFVSHEYNTYRLPDTLNSTAIMNKWTEHNLSVGGMLSETQGKTLHFNLLAEAWIAGADAGQLTVDFNTDLNFPLFGDTVRLAANASFQRITPSFYLFTYHSKHFWWDNDDFSNETHTRLEGTFTYDKTNTSLRVGVEEIQNYTYFGMGYDATTSGRTNMWANVYQESSNLHVLMAQLHQNFRLGPLNWENVVTFQNTNNSDVLPLPRWNIFSNLYLKFKIARVLGVELGADATYFSKYYAPDFCPGINQFAVQQNADSRVELGGYPFIDVYANMTLKGVRFFVMMNHVNAGSGNKMSFLTPHYPVNSSVLHLGVSWPFFN